MLCNHFIKELERVHEERPIPYKYVLQFFRKFNQFQLVHYSVGNDASIEFSDDRYKTNSSIVGELASTSLLRDESNINSLLLIC